MKHQKTLAIILLIPFSLLSIYAVLEVGYFGIFDYHRHSPAGWQVFTDLVIALVLVLTWMIPQAKREGRNPWPWVGITLFLGSIGPLLYLATAKSAGKVDAEALSVSAG
ncbi:MAG: hypothetical protein MI746_02515 [Pseudomonadales bacterium]|nr:hypothetical protein [Pseudomonadales bacterium]